jgi:hypothetical protein
VSLVGAPAFAGENGARLDDCIHVSIQGSNMVEPGTDVYVPVVISEVTGWGILAFEMEICWCDLPAGLLQYEGCAPGIVMENSGWMPPICNPCDVNCVSVAAASPTPLVGNGPLFYLKFHISANAKPCMCCKIWFREVNLYDPEDPLNVCPVGGQVCVNWCDVAGVLKYWYCEYDPCEGWYRPMGLAGARVHLWDCHDPVASDYTDGEGRFMFACLDPLVNDCYYCVGVDYCLIPDGWIGAYDASLILQYLVCGTGLTDCGFRLNGGFVYPQQVAADVNCTSVITAYDAALVLQYVVGILPTFPCPEMWTWFVLEPGSCVLSCPGFMEFVGVLRGDVSGPRAGAGDFLTMPTALMRLGVARSHDGYLDIPVLIEDATDVFSAEFEVAFDSDAYSFVEVNPVGLTGGFMTSFMEQDGRIRVAMASATSVAGSGRMAIVRLEKKTSAVPGASVRPSLVEAMLNEGVPAVEIETRGFVPLAENFMLGPVSPNPFRQSTAITFAVSGGANISVDIYNVAGRLVCTVFNGRVEAGEHSVGWDGTDSQGARVARGVYFCRMSAEGFSATEKVVLLQ